MKKILIIEDEYKIAEVVEAYLHKEGYETALVKDGQHAMGKFLEFQPDLIILDLMLPNVSGEEICKSVRAISKVPIIMLTAKSLEDDKIAGLDMGADDYLTKPFSPRELVARIAALSRRLSKSVSKNEHKWSFNSGDLCMDLEAYSVTKNARNISLTRSEFNLLKALSSRPNKAFTRDELIEIALDMDYEVFDRTVDSHIKNLRAKIEDDTSKPSYIITVRGVGYRFGGIKDN